MQFWLNVHECVMIKFKKGLEFIYLPVSFLSRSTIHILFVSMNHLQTSLRIRQALVEDIPQFLRQINETKTLFTVLILELSKNT